MADIKTDVSPAAVAAMLSYLRGACVGYGEEADFIRALAIERDELAAKLAEVERERDQERTAFVKACLSG